VKWISKKKKKPLLLLIIIIFIIASLLDIKYEGLFFQLLPHSMQSYLADIFK
jgi:predicted membrane protein